MTLTCFDCNEILYKTGLTLLTIMVNYATSTIGEDSQLKSAETPVRRERPRAWIYFGAECTTVASQSFPAGPSYLYMYKLSVMERVTDS